MNKVSIIIPTFNAESFLEELLESLKTQSINAYELIIIDSSSSDKTVAIAQKYTEYVVLIPQDEFDHGGTRAMAAQRASGDIILFLTQDALPVDEFSIENIVKVFDDSSIAGAYGRQISYKHTNLFGKHLREFNYPMDSIVRTKNDIEQYGIKTAQLSNSFAAYRKSVLLECGNFKSNLILGEDVYMGAKMILADYKLIYVADALVYHSHSYTILQEFKRYFDIGVFHKSESWILERFGRAESEGMKYIKSERNYLLEHGAWYLLPAFILRNLMKYIGYKVGQRYKSLPLFLLKEISMHKHWW